MRRRPWSRVRWSPVTSGLRVRGLLAPNAQWRLLPDAGGLPDRAQAAAPAVRFPAQQPGDAASDAVRLDEEDQQEDDALDDVEVRADEGRGRGQVLDDDGPDDRADDALAPGHEHHD